MKKPLCIDLFCGMFGWGRGFLAEGWQVVGFDLAHEPYHGDVPEGAELVLQDVLTLHGSQFRNADIIVASPPCQKYSWLAMPWGRSTSNHSQAAKALRRKWETEGPDNRLFDACFRIQKEAIEATGTPCPDCDTGWPDGRMCITCRGAGALNTRFIPLIVENVRGAQPWVGRSAWNFGSFHLWGDVPALMPITKPAAKRAMDDLKYGQRKSLHAHLPIGDGPLGRKVPMNFHEHAKTGKPGRSFQSVAVEEGLKIGGDWFSDPKSTCRKHSSRSHARKAASAQIAKIPFELSSWIARVYKPESRAA